MRRSANSGKASASYTDRAIIEYTAASHYFEKADHVGYRARAENNFGFLLYLVGRYQDAHEHLNSARFLFTAVKEKGRIAQVDDARARVFLARGRTREAERAIRGAVRVLAKGGEQALRAEVLTTLGRVLAKTANERYCLPLDGNTCQSADFRAWLQVAEYQALWFKWPLGTAPATARASTSATATSSTARPSTL